MKSERWGLVLTGGGGKGAYQFGVLKAMEELGIMDSVDAIAGSSIGALNALLLTQQDIEKEESIWNSITPKLVLAEEVSLNEVLENVHDTFDGVKEYLESRVLSEYLKNGSEDGLCSRNGLKRILDEKIDYEKVRQYPKEIYITIARMVDGTPVAEYHTLRDKTDQQIKRLVLASSALPVIYEAVRIDGVMYRDGGIADNMPVKPLRELGMKNLIVVKHTPGKVELVKTEKDKENKIIICPSHNIGDFLDGTLDFSHEGIVYRMALGYYDGRSIFREQERIDEGKVRNPLEFRMELLENHNRSLADRKRIMLSEEVSYHLDQFSKYEHYYDK